MRNPRKLWFRAYEGFTKLFHKPTRFVHLGKTLEGPSVVLSNHVGTSGPLSFELFMDKPIRFWGAYEMNSGLRSMYRYQSEIYYHEKKGWNIHLAKLFCLLASPLTTVFYRGLNLISTYRDIRFRITIKESIEALQQGQNIVIFPEVSNNGYLDELEGFHCGFLSLLRVAKQKGLDLPVYVTYFNKDNHVHMIDAPVLYSDLIKSGATHQEIADMLCRRCNELGRMTRKGQSDAEPKEMTKVSKIG